ncbi:MAG TPA: peptidoglycan DD-metalloendopeptidase family protein [Gaiellaceae bacterium]|nr:peptidoglycan DD-metalloendopeptidase family protein [Gaiellaceae bacterium]
MVDARRICLLAGLLGLVLALAGTGALAQSPSERKERIDRKISGLRDEIEAAKRKEGVLTSEIEAATQRIDALGGDIGSLSAVIAELEADLAVHRNRLARLKERIKEQSEGIEHLMEQFQIAQARLEERLVELYQNEETDTFGILLQVQSLGDLVDQFEYFEQLGRQDHAITVQIRELRSELKVARAETKGTKEEVAAETQVLARKTAEQVAARDELLAQQNALAAARANRQGMLAGVQAHRHEAEEDVEAMAAESARLAARIRASSGGGSGGDGSTGSGESSSGFIWPVNGVVTSGFGWRWGRMHEGIDIAAPSGTPIRAAAGGTIIYTGYMGGYGNITIIDHGNGLATAYAHQSAIYIGGGSVSQGTVIGAVGSTGNSTGPHLHFEVRVNGSAVDPMGYL